MKNFLLTFLWAPVELWLIKTGRQSLTKIIVWGLCQLFRKKGKQKMSFIKEIPVGSLGKIKIEEDAGKASIELSIEESVGGGQASGVAKLSAGAKAEVDAKHLIDLGFDLAASKFPSAAGLIQAAKLAVDAEVSKA